MKQDELDEMTMRKDLLDYIAPTLEDLNKILTENDMEQLFFLLTMPIKRLKNFLRLLENIDIDEDGVREKEEVMKIVQAVVNFKEKYYWGKALHE